MVYEALLFGVGFLGGDSVGMLVAEGYEGVDAALNFRPARSRYPRYPINAYCGGSHRTFAWNIRPTRMPRMSQVSIRHFDCRGLTRLLDNALVHIQPPTLHCNCTTKRSRNRA